MSSLYDDIDESKTKEVAGWSTGIKLLQSQMVLKKAMVTQPRREALRKHAVPAAPTHASSLKSETVVKVKTENEEMTSYSKPTTFVHHGPLLPTIIPKEENTLSTAFEWDVVSEYDPLCPNDYDKITRERREKRGMELELEEVERKKRAKEERELKSRERLTGTGFAGRKGSDDEEETSAARRVAAQGAAIAPPPSLQQESSSPAAQPSAGLGYAAKIMAKYGFKEGQGLGKQHQGIATALQVEKTSKRGGRILTEAELAAQALSPPVPAPVAAAPQPYVPPKAELSIAEMMKNPSKVVLLRNMTGPGEVDDDLEPEVHEECQGKYGDVNKVLIYEIPTAPDDEAVRIFVEFKRIESAIKAVVDLNGRFFGGRQVKASFYSLEKFHNLQLSE